MEIAICDMCGKKMSLRGWRASVVSVPFRLGRRVLHLEVNVLQGKPNVRGRQRRGRKHLDLCKPCTLKAVAVAIRTLDKK